MATFELDGGHGTLVQPMRPRADSFDADSAALVADHVSDLLGEHVLPVREGAPGGPHLLALDATARPVVVEVVQQLDGSGLVRALRHAGAASRLSRAELARAYRGGPEAFEADLAVFRDRAPILQAQAPARPGARLVVVCADVAEDVLEAVDHVTAGGGVEVLRLGVTQGPGGRRYVDVSPLRATPGPRRAVEPGPRTGAVPVTTGRTATSTPARGTAPTDPTPVVPAAAAPAAGAPEHHRHAAPAPEQRPAPRADETTLLPPVVDDVPAPRDGDAVAALPELEALASAERGDLELVWHRVRRNQRLVATLRADGLIELEDGSVHADPSDAATAAADLERPADGWRVWRFGEDGPTLGEAVGA
ncbi:restriction system modified-DNA reader domain-containing protein [Cellulomonas pakistanensis]|uniref:RAMA domain-containing protein n=1 Tax=Cellulomonas pakistanensis TaxID=992287 RepID=A0A919PAH5_9CELL|nr:hypothetical protein [Cellulomonas pakistanensis]GIG35374.1 hypothetical protein Cpa01nite_07550 [Cellulomonas pakistanensis]